MYNRAFEAKCEDEKLDTRAFSGSNLENRTQPLVNEGFSLSTVGNSAAQNS